MKNASAMSLRARETYCPTANIDNKATKRFQTFSPGCGSIIIRIAAIAGC
jgi:hypothetical protein